MNTDPTTLLLAQMKELHQLMTKAHERVLAGGSYQYPVELEEWIDDFTAANDSVLMVLSATRYTFRLKSIVRNYNKLHENAHLLCERIGVDYDAIFKGVTERDRVDDYKEIAVNGGSWLRTQV